MLIEIAGDATYDHVRDAAVDLGLDGHPERISEFSIRRRLSRRGLTMAARALVYLLLARCGWEVEPLPRPGAARADAGQPERA